MSSRHLPRLGWFTGGAVGALAAVALLGGSGSLSQDRGKPDAASTPSAQAPFQLPNDGKLRIIAFGAHPDDCELKVSGVGAKWAALGHHVKFVSVTNGDIGHWKMAGGPLALRRYNEVKECAKILGIHTQVLDIHDGELLPTLENRRTITKLIREWQADVVFSHRPNDYHPDHRNVGLLVQDAAYMVTVPFFCPDIPHLTKNPVFLYYEDRFTKPTRFTADIVVAVDDVIDKKLACVEALHSQFYEGGANGGPQLVPDPDNKNAVAARKKAVRDSFDKRFAASATQHRLQLGSWYGDAAAKNVKYAEAFEVCEYGRMPAKQEVRKLFPFLPQAP